MDGLVVVILLLGCAPGAPRAVDCVPTASWSDADLALRSCRACHSLAMVPLSTPTDVLAVRDALPVALSDPAHGQIAPSDAEAIEAWLTCPDMPPTEPDPCEGGTWSGDVGPEADPCATGATRVAGAVVVGPQSPDRSCLCAVEGDLAVAADVALPNLASIGGTLIVQSGPTALRLPALSAAGGMHLQGADTLQVARLPGLEVLGGPLVVDAPNLRELDLPRVTTVQALDATHALNLERLDLPRLHTVVGDAVVSGLPYLELFSASASLVAVGGTLELSELPSWRSAGPFVLEEVGGGLTIHGTDLVTLDGFEDLQEVPGELALTGNRLLTRIDGFRRLARVGEALRVSGNELLVTLHGFDALNEVGLDGDAVAQTHNLRIAFDFALTDVKAFGALAQAGGVTVVGNEQLESFDLPSLKVVDHELALRTLGGTTLDGMNALESVGTLELTGHATLETLGGFRALRNASAVVITDNVPLQRIVGLTALAEIDGDLQLARNRDLFDLAGFASLERVGGDLDVSFAPSLSTAEVDALVEQIDLGGAVIR